MAGSQDVAVGVNNDPSVKAALFNAMAGIYSSGKVEAASSMTVATLCSEPSVTAAVKNYSLSAEQTQLLAQAVKITSSMIIAEPAKFAAAPKIQPDAIMPAQLTVPAQEFKALTEGKAEAPVEMTVQAKQPFTPVSTQQSPAIAPVASQQVPSDNSVIPAVTGAINAPESSPDISNETTAYASKIVAEVKALISELNSVFTASSREIPAEVRELAAKVEDLGVKIEALAKSSVPDAELIRNITEEVSALLTVVNGIIYGSAASSAGTVTAINAEGNAAIGPDAGSTKDNNSGGRQLTVAAPLNDTQKDLLSKIYGLLKQMNGELSMTHRTEYVYKPYSGSSSQVTPDGMLLINTAKPEAGMPASAAARTIEYAALVRPEANAPVMPAVQASPAIVNETSNPAVNQAAVNEVSAQAPAAQDPSFVIRPARNIDTAAVNLSGYVTKPAEDAEWVSAELNTASAAAASVKQQEPAPAVRVFDMAAAFAAKSKETLIIRQVAEGINAAAASVPVKGKTEIRMFLRPDNLGAISISLDSSDKVITGRIETASQDVRDVLKAALPELKIALANAGLNVAQLDVSMMGNYIGSNLPDSNGSSYREWEGAALRPDAGEQLENAGIVTGTDGYLDFLA